MNPYEDDDTVDELPAPPRKDIPAADLELLELAARALGAVRVEEIDGEGMLILHFAKQAPEYGWNPLVHSDDALRLSVRLEIDVMHRVVGGRRAEAYAPGFNIVAEPYKGNPLTATKRAIVRAAAAVGNALSRNNTKA